MTKNLTTYFAIMLLACFNLGAQTNVKVMFYNLLNYPLEDAVPNREPFLATVLSDYQPDLFLVCELNNETGANNVLNIVQNAVSADYTMATYVSNTSDDLTGNQNDLQNLLYYDSTKFILLEEIIVPTDLRDFNVYKLRLNTVDQNTNPIELYVVVCHLKASSGPDNAQQRFEMVQELDNYLNTLPASSNVLLGGDLNIYTANESAFQELLDVTNNITFADPPNRIGSWNNNVNFVDVFTQSTRTQSGLGGSTGGFDDRFDFILTSENMLSSANLTYVADSYKAYGNNGVSSCYNRAINSSDCAGPEFSFAIRDALHNFSDHLPVTLSLQTSALLNTPEFDQSNYIKIKNNITSYYLDIYNNSFELINEVFVVFNQLGQRVKMFKISEGLNSIDVSHFKNGLYYIVTKDIKFKPKKFIVYH
ncbi:MAG: hypothetical protein KJO96_09675 [Winogradskyella sp.]|nr:hypothetical protein [Winogradskyella sp.]